MKYLFAALRFCLALVGLVLSVVCEILKIFVFIFASGRIFKKL